MFAIYRFLINILYPVVVIIIFIRKLINKEDALRYKEKIFSSHFRVNRKKNTKLIWFHAASVGEVKSVLPIIKTLINDNNLEILITTITLSSSKIVEENIGNNEIIHHRFFPVDTVCLIRKFLSLWKPNAIFLVDSEIWPNLISQAKKKNISLAIINARITKKSFDKWRLVPSFARDIFGKIDICLVSNIESKTYLQKLNAKNVFYFGNIKLIDTIKKNSLKNINHDLLTQGNVWCAASTHKGEEKFCLEVHKILKQKFKNLITIIAPRHIERSNEIKNLSSKFGFNTQVLNKNDLIIDKNEIIILNSFGELPKFFNYAKSVFVGKTLLEKLKKDSGQNPIDAARLGCKVYHGPFIYNFKEIFEILKNHQISEFVKTPETLANFLTTDLKNTKKDNKNFLLELDNLQQKIFLDTINKIKKFIK